MYTRNFGKQKYSPPPGYVGTAFSEAMPTKHHEPTEIIRIEKPEEEVSESETYGAEPIDRQPEENRYPENPVKQLLEGLKGKIGSEELIILLVMVLIAADGFSPEIVILGLLLAMR